MSAPTLATNIFTTFSQRSFYRSIRACYISTYFLLLLTNFYWTLTLQTINHLLLQLASDTERSSAKMKASTHTYKYIYIYLSTSQHVLAWTINAFSRHIIQTCALAGTKPKPPAEELTFGKQTIELLTYILQAEVSKNHSSKFTTVENAHIFVAVSGRVCVCAPATKVGGKLGKTRWPHKFVNASETKALICEWMKDKYERIVEISCTYQCMHTYTYICVCECVCSIPAGAAGWTINKYCAKKKNEMKINKGKAILQSKITKCL